jgi:uncharacterized ion transporter superfamily protein YfcC
MVGRVWGGWLPPEGGFFYFLKRTGRCILIPRNRMPTHSAAITNGIARNVWLCISMFVLAVGGIAYVIVRDGFLEERYGKHNLLAHTNLYEAFVIDVVFLIVPFIGSCRAFRLTRSADRFTKIVGWLFLAIFFIFFFQAAEVCWTQYHNYLWVLGN